MVFIYIEKISWDTSLEYTSIELIGGYRFRFSAKGSPSNLKRNVANAKVWTHKIRAAEVMVVMGKSTGLAISDPKRLLVIKEQLATFLREQ